MPEPIHRGGTWWQEQPNGSWLRFDDATGQWSPSTAPPPPPSATDLASPSRTQSLAAQPDAYHAYEVEGAYVPLSKLHKWVVGLLIVAVIVEVAALLSDFSEISLLQRFESGEFTSQAEALDAAETNDDRQASLGGLQVILLVATGIVFLRWVNNAYKNVARLGAHNRYSSGWAIGAWFVPILNFFRPKQIMDDIWRASDPELPPDMGRRYDGAPVPAAFHWWWAAWLVSNLTGLVFRGLSDGNTLSELQRASLFRAIGDGTSIVAGILLILIVRSTTERQEARARALQTAAAVAAAEQPAS